MPVTVVESVADLLEATRAPPPSDWQILGGALLADVHSEAMRDVLGHHTVEHSEALERACRAARCIISRAKEDRPPCRAPVRIVNLDAPPEEFERELLEDVILLGDEAAPLASLYRRFRESREPRYVRLDTPESYREFRISQSPEMVALQEKVAELETILREHMADGHGGQALVLGYVAEIRDLEAVCGLDAKRVPIRMPEFADGAWDCWLEGEVVCGSLALPGPDGDFRIATSASPIGPHLDRACGYLDSGASVTELLGVLPTLSAMLGGAEILPALARAAPSLLAYEEEEGGAPLVGKIVPQGGSASLPALIALLQGAQAGDPRAIAEWQRLCDLAMAKACEVADVLRAALDEAASRLALAQRS